MKRQIRKKLLAIVAAIMFVGMMGLSVTKSNNGTDISLAGIEALASGSTAACYSTYSGCWIYNCWKVFLCNSDGTCEDTRTKVDAASDPC